MIWHRTLIILALLLLVTAPAVSALEEDVGFWTRVKYFFTDEPTSSSDESSEPQIVEVIDTTCTSTTNTCLTAEGERITCNAALSECEQKYQKCECGLTDEKRDAPYDTSRDLPSPAPDTETPVLSCSRCFAIVCDTAEGKEFLCPGTLVSCKEKYDSSCRELGCYPEDSCTARKHTCWPSTLAGPTDRSVICEGPYDDCVQKYGKCECGVTETTYCVYDNQKHLPGETFPATDGCNTCSCTETGRVACTLRACPADERVCTTDKDCPVINCIRAPCPVSACIDGVCTTKETDERSIY